MQNKRFRFGPLALTTTLTTNILNPGAASGGVGAGTPNLYILLKHVRITNKHATVAATVSLWLGATGANTAGTEIGYSTTAIPAAGGISDWYPVDLRLDVADFLVGGSNTATALTIEGEGEIGIA